MTVIDDCEAARTRRVAAEFVFTAPPPGFIDDPYPTYAALRCHDPVHAMGPGQWLLTRHDDVSALYREGSASSDKQREFGPKFGVGTPIYEHHTSSLVFNDAPLHTRVRRLMLGAVNQRAVARMETGLERLVDGLLERMAGLDRPDLISDFAARIPLEVIGNLLDVPQGERAPLQEWSLAILSALEPTPGAQRLERANAAVSEFLAYLRGLVAQRRRAPGDPQVDVLTRLIQGEQGGERLTEGELLHNCIFLLNAGHETTTNLIGNGVHALMGQRSQWQRWAAEPGLAPLAVEELLRYESPLQLNNRMLTAPMLLRGRELAAGDFITLGVGAANRDPEAFDQPDRLDIARKPNPHVAFGHGAHACLGMSVARLEGRLALSALVTRFPRLELRGEPQRDRRLRFRGFRSLPVSLG